MQAKLMAKYENMKHKLFQKNSIVTYKEVHVELHEIYLKWMLEDFKFHLNITRKWSNIMFRVHFLEARIYIDRFEKPFDYKHVSTNR